MTKNDFGMSFTDANGTFIRLEEINRMKALSIITVDEDLLREYRFDTQVQYDKEKFSREEVRKHWRNI